MSDQRSATVFDFASYKNKETVELLEEALRRAKAGEITGVVFAFYCGERHHGVGVTGHYRQHPIDVVAVSGQIFKYYSEDLNVIVKK